MTQWIDWAFAETKAALPKAAYSFALPLEREGRRECNERRGVHLSQLAAREVHVNGFTPPPALRADPPLEGR